MGATPKHKKGNAGGISLFKGGIILVIVGATFIVLMCQLVLFRSFHQNVELPMQPVESEESQAVRDPDREHVKITASNIDFCKQAGTELQTAAAAGDALASPPVRTDVDNTAGQRMRLLVVHKPYDDVAWVARFRDIADVDVRTTRPYEDDLQEFIQYIVDSYDDLPPLIGFLHGPLDDWHYLPGGSLARWNAELVGEGGEHGPRTRLQVDELVQAFKYVNRDPEVFKKHYANGFLGFHDLAQEYCTDEDIYRMKVYLRCKWRSEPWLYRLREKFGWDDATLAGANISCRRHGNSIVHRDFIWKHSLVYWKSMLHTAEALSQEVQWMWKRHVDTHKVLHGLAFWPILVMMKFDSELGWFGNKTFRPPGGFRKVEKRVVDDHNRDTHISPLPKALPPPYARITLTPLLRSAGTWAREVVNLGMYSCGKGQFVAECIAKHWTNCTCLTPCKEMSLNKWHFIVHAADYNYPPFRIHIVREPGQYYVGLWKFLATYARMKHPHAVQWRCLSGDTPDTDFFPHSMRGGHVQPKFPQHAIAFRKWVKNVHHGTTLGTVTWRMWATQRLQDWNWTQTTVILKSFGDDGQRGDCARRQGKKKVREIHDKFHDMDSLFSMAHCWVSTSNMEQDLAHCLRQFESIHPGHINLEYMREIEALPKHQPSWPCEEMYDKETKELVEFLDAPVYKRFGFKHCKSHGFHERH